MELTVKEEHLMETVVTSFVFNLVGWGLFALVVICFLALVFSHPE